MECSLLCFGSITVSVQHITLFTGLLESCTIIFWNTPLGGTMTDPLELSIYHSDIHHSVFDKLFTNPQNKTLAQIVFKICHNFILKLYLIFLLNCYYDY